MTVSFRRSLAWLGASQIASFVIVFAGSVVLARFLTPYEMGVYAAAAAVLGILGALRAFGLPNIIIREPELTSSLASTAFTINAGLCLLSSLLLLMASRVAEYVYGDPSIERLLTVLAVLPTISILEFLPAAYLERIGAFQKISMISLGKVVISALVTVYLAYSGCSFMSIAWANLVASAFTAISFNVFGRDKVSLRLDLSEWRKIGTFGVQMLMINVLGAMVPRFFDLILGRIVGLEALGLWSRAWGLNNMLWDNIHVIVARVVFVDFSERQRRSLPLRESYLRVGEILTGVLWPAFTGLAIVSGPVVYTVYGPAWTGAATPLALMSLAGVILTAVTMIWEVYVVRGEIAAQIRFQVRRAAISLTLFVLGCFGGLHWAAASRLGDSFAAVMLAKADLQRMTGTEAADYPPIYLRSAVLAVAACLPAAALMQAHSWSVETSFIQVLGAVALGGLLWLIGLRLFRHPIYEEIRNVAGRLLARRHSKPQASTPAVD